MRPKTRRAALLGVVLAACAGPRSAGHPAPASPAAAPVGAEEARAALDGAIERSKAPEPDASREALRDLRALVARPGFAELPPDLRHDALLMAGFLAMRLDDPASAQPLLQRSSEMPEAGSVDVRARLDASWRLHDERDVVRALTLLARRWPGDLAEIEDEIVYLVVADARRLPPEEDAFFLLANALHGAGWAPKKLLDPSEVWKDLAIDLLAHGDADRAAAVAAKVSSPQAIAAMRVDRRLDAIVAASPERFDVARAQAREVERYRARVRDEPRSMKALNLLAWTLLVGGAHAEVLAVTERPVADLGRVETVAWDDADDAAAGLMDTRARALRRAGRWSEAVELLSRASARGREGRPDVNETINLALLLCALDPPEEARATLDRVPMENTSPYGRMEIARGRALAAAQLGDAGALDAALAYLRDHREDGVEVLQDTLVSVGRLDEAAALYVSRLADPRLRSAALTEIQDCEQPRLTRRETEWLARWRELVARPDVREAIAHVGRVETFPMCF